MHPLDGQIIPIKRIVTKFERGYAKEEWLYLKTREDLLRLQNHELDAFMNSAVLEALRYQTTYDILKILKTYN